MSAVIELVLFLFAPATGGALAMHLWQTRPRRITHTGYAVGQTPMRIHKRPQAKRHHHATTTE